MVEEFYIIRSIIVHLVLSETSFLTLVDALYTISSIMVQHPKPDRENKMCNIMNNVMAHYLCCL